MLLKASGSINLSSSLPIPQSKLSPPQYLNYCKRFSISLCIYSCLPSTSFYHRSHNVLFKTNQQKSTFVLCSPKDMYKIMPCSIICNSIKPYTTQTSITTGRVHQNSTWQRKQNELYLGIAIWRNLRNMMLNEANQTQRSTYNSTYVKFKIRQNQLVPFLQLY